MNDTDAEQWAFEAFAQAHPHEAYQTHPERFWAYFQTIRPGMAREDMEKLLLETDQP